MGEQQLLAPPVSFARRCTHLPARLLRVPPLIGRGAGFRQHAQMLHEELRSPVKVFVSTPRFTPPLRIQTLQETKHGLCHRAFCDPSADFLPSTLVGPTRACRLPQRTAAFRTDLKRTAHARQQTRTSSKLADALYGPAVTFYSATRGEFQLPRTASLKHSHATDII